MISKKDIRNLVAERRDRLTPGELSARSAAVEARLFSYEPFVSARTVMFFVSFRSEVLTEGMIKRALDAGKCVVAPVVRLETRELVASELKDFDSELAEGAYGIPEPKPEFVRPVPPEEIDFAAVPGLAFDRAGHRVGYGGGFYDRFIERLRPDAHLAALAFSFQLFDEVPFQQHDRKIHAVITDAETLIVNG